MKNNNRLIQLTASLIFCHRLAVQVSFCSGRKPHNYAFMSAQDLYDALSQQSQIALGYLLGIVDARKDRKTESGCFTALAI